MSQETRHEIIEGNELRKLKEADKVLKEAIQWVVDSKAPHMQELRVKVQDVMDMRPIFNTMLFMMNNGVLCYNMHSDPTKTLQCSAHLPTRSKIERRVPDLS